VSVPTIRFFVVCLLLLLPVAARGQARDVLAVVDGVSITTAQVDEQLAASLAKLHEQIYSQRRAQLDSLIDEQLLKREAERRRLTPDALVDAEITARAQPVTTADAAAFYETNKAKLQGGTFAALQDQIKTYLTSQRLTARRQEFLAALRQKATVNVLLEAPAPYRATVPVAGAHVRGRADAPVTIVEFSDFHCPFCRRANPVIQQVMAKYGDRVRLVYKDMPLDNLHPNARAAAEAARCAGAQGKFWEFHDKLFAGEPDVATATLNRFAQEIGINVATFEACVKARTPRAQVEASVQDGARLGVTGTPTFFINGRILTGAQPLDAFVRIVDEELQQSKPATAARR
jgi:protein-disulfide isomerase